MNFSELMKCYYISEDDNNQIVYDQLLSAMKKQNVTPVIGAGLSCWAFPLWSEMLKKQAENYGLEQEMEALFKDKRYEKAASMLNYELTHNRFIRILQQTFRTDRIKEHVADCPEYLKMLPDLFKGPVITTNFDRVIEYLFEATGTASLDMVIPSDNFQSEKIKRALHGNHPVLIKMHGDIEDPEHLVLTEESYDITYGKNLDCPDLSLPMPNFLQKVLERNPLLFLGCSLDNDRTCSVIKRCSSGCPQFAFLELPEDTNNTVDPTFPILKGENQKIMNGLRARQRAVIGELNIQVIWYPYHMHEESFKAFFNKLYEDLNAGYHSFSSISTNRLISKMPQTRDVFYGRDDLIEEIHDAFSEGKRALFLEGIGGIGKSELAKRFAERYEDEYENIQFLTYTSDLKDLICDQEGIQIENFKQSTEESKEEFCHRKLQLLQKLADEKTLFIVDNFDVENDPWLKRFLEGKYRVIFTTRYTHPGYFSIRVKAIKNLEALINIFSKNYEGEIREEEIPYLEDIFKTIEYHTYAIELIAKQMKVSYLSAQKMLELLKAGQFPAPETVAGRDGQKTAFEHICSLFKVNNLSDKEKEIMMELSLIGIEGIPVNRFQEWGELTSFESVNQLIRKSWIRRERTDYEQKFSLHPLVKEVVDYELQPSIEKCRSFLDHAAEFCHWAWFRDYQENLDVSNNILEILKYFETPIGREIQFFNPWINFLWQVGKFEESIYYSHKLYDSCLGEFGEDSMETGYAAKTVGGCYFNSGKEDKSIYWYKRGLACMKKATDDDSEDLALSYEKVGRCYTWENNPERDFKEAKKNFDIALQMRLRLLDAIKNGKKLRTFCMYEDYGLTLAEARIGENYMEIGRMYFASKDYEKALKYAILYEERLSHDDKSGKAYSYFDQGRCHYYLGKEEEKEKNDNDAMKEWQQAEELLTKALEINMKMRGGLAIDTIANQEQLADVYLAMSKGFSRKALNGFFKAKSMAENLLGKNCDRINSINQKIQNVSV